VRFAAQIVAQLVTRPLAHPGFDQFAVVALCSLNFVDPSV